jgi:hypothetical protein
LTNWHKNVCVFITTVLLAFLSMGGDGGSGGALSNILSGTVAGFAQVAAGKMKIHECCEHVYHCARLDPAESCAALNI